MNSPSSHYLGIRLRSLIWSCLDCDLIRSAIFFAERYYCVDPQNHQAIHLYANALFRGGHTHSALNVVNDMTCWGCVEVYSRCCNALGRFRDGQVALSKLMEGSTTATAALDPSTFQEARQFPDAAVFACRAGMMSMKGNLERDAVANFNRALAINPFIWEAFEGLCQLGSFPEVDEIMPSRGQFAAKSSIPKASASQQPISTPEIFSNPVGAQRLNGAIAGKSMPFRLHGNYPGGRDSIGSAADSSFGELNSPAFRPRMPNQPEMLTSLAVNGISRIQPSEIRPLPKRFRGEIGASIETLSDTNFANKTLNVRAALPAAPKRGSQRASQESREPTRRSLRATTTSKFPPASKRGDRKRNGVVPLSTLSTAGETDDEMMTVDALHMPRTPLESAEALKSSARGSQMVERIAVEEADAYILELVRLFAKAVQNLARFQCQAAVEDLEALPTEQQRSATVMTLLGRSYFERMDYAKAARCFQQAREMDPYRLQDMELYSTLLWHLQKQTLLSFLSQEFLAMDNTSPISWIAAGNCFSLEKEHQQALTCFRRATQLDPRCVYAYNLSGMECVTIEDYSKAIDFFRSAIAIDARHYPAWYGMGMAFFKTNKYNVAQWHFRRAIEINPSNALLWSCDGMVHEVQREWPQALEMYTKAASVAPTNPLVMFRRTRMLVVLERFDEALGILNHLKDIIPNEVNIPFMLSQIYRRLGKVKESAQHMALALDIDPKISGVIRTAQRGGKIILDALAPIAAEDESMEADMSTMSVQ